MFSIPYIYRRNNNYVKNIIKEIKDLNETNTAQQHSSTIVSSDIQNNNQRIKDSQNKVL